MKNTHDIIGPKDEVDIYNILINEKDLSDKEIEQLSSFIFNQSPDYHIIINILVKLDKYYIAERLYNKYIKGNEEKEIMFKKSLLFELNRGIKNIERHYSLKDFKLELDIFDLERLDDVLEGKLKDEYMFEDVFDLLMEIEEYRKNMNHYIKQKKNKKKTLKIFRNMLKY